jgi:hypothetical protein
MRSAWRQIICSSDKRQRQRNQQQACQQQADAVSTANGHRWLTSAGLKPVFASLDEKTLQQLNARIAVEGQDAKRVAADINGSASVTSSRPVSSRPTR